MNKQSRNPASVALGGADLAHRKAAGKGLGDIQISILIRLNYFLMNDLLDQELAPHGLTSASYIALMSLYGMPGHTANPSNLCVTTGETRANMTRICDELAAKGWIRRVPSEEDRRRIDLFLTEQGVALLNKTVPLLRDRVDVLFSNFSASEKANLATLLTKLNQTMESRL